MKPSDSPNPVQPDLFRPRLVDIIDPAHPLVKLADAIDWSIFEKHLSPAFGDKGRAAKPVRLMVGLHYLKYAFDHSDESVVEGWVENPYWQYFCGSVFFEHTAPIEASSMTKWRVYLKEAGVEEMLAETIRTGLRRGFVKPCDLARVNVDTTAQEKNIRFPTDARLLDRSRERLVRRARSRGIALRQTYVRLGKQALRRHSGYAAAKQFKRAEREERRLRTFLGRVVRDIERKCNGTLGDLQEEIDKARRLLAQKRGDSGKLYSLHEPHVECIAKGKAHKRYEFGCKVGVVTSARSNWILGAKAFHGARTGRTADGGCAASGHLRSGVSRTWAHGNVRGSNRQTPPQGLVAGDALLVEAPLGHRTGDRAHEGREPNGTQPPGTPDRR